MSILLGKKDPTVLSDFTPQSEGSSGAFELMTKAYDNFEANRTSISDAMLMEEELQPYVDLLNKETEGGFNYKGAGAIGSNPGMALRIGIFNDEYRLNNFVKASDQLEKSIKNLYESNPEKYKDLKDFSVLSAYQRAMDRAVSMEKEYNEIVQRSPGLASWAATTAGEIGSAATDPAYALTYVIGAGQTGLLRIALTEAALGAGAETLVANKVQDWYKETGREFTDEEFWNQVMLGGVIGFGAPFAFKGAGKGIKMTAKQAYKGFKALRGAGSRSTPEGQAVEIELDNQINIEETNPLTSTPRDPFEPTPKDFVDQALDAAKEAKEELSAALKAKDAAAAKIDDDLDAGKITLEQAKQLESELPEFIAFKKAQEKFKELDEAANKAVADDAKGIVPEQIIPSRQTETAAVAEHRERLELAEQAVEANQAPPIPDQPTIPPRPYRDVYEPDINTGDKMKFEVDELLVDAKTFQYKEGGDELGVVSELLEETTWEPTSAGDVFVYEYADGRRFIVDGHQRLALAKRILAKDPKQNIQLWGFLFRQVDGFLPEQIRAEASKKNLREGKKERGTEVIEAAKLFRDDPKYMADMTLRTSIQKQGYNVAQLSSANFQTIINGVIPTNYAAIIGRLIPDDAGLQEAAIKVIAKTNPKNVVEAESIVRQVRESGAEQIKQTTLFGDEIISESYYLERAKLISRVTTALKKDKQAFQTLVKNAQELEDAGNVLARSENERRAFYDQTAIALVQTLANRRGALSDELTKAARLARSTGKYDEAERMVLDAIRRGIANGDFEGINIGDAGATFQRSEESRTKPDRIDQAAEEFTEPGGIGAERQVNQLEEDIFGARADEPVDPAIQQRQEVGKLLDGGAPIEEIEQHPAVVNALEEAKVVQETHLMSGYGTEQWQTSRTFKFDLEEVTGYLEAVRRLYDDAKILAYRNTGKDIPANPIDFNKQATIIIGAPAAGKSSIAEPIAVARRAAIIDGDEAKKVMPEYGGGIGANAVHKESQVIINVVEALAKEDGANIVIPTVGANPDKIRSMIANLKDQGYTVAIIDAQVSAKESMIRMLRRFVSEGRLIPIQTMKGYGNKPSQTYDILKQEGVADGYARIDNNGPKDADRIILEDTAGILEGTDLRLRDGRDGSAIGGTRALGEEFGGENIIETDSSLELDMEIPIMSQSDQAGGFFAEVKTIRQLKEEAAQENQMLNRLEGCVS